MTSTERRWSSSSNRSDNVKFPDFESSPTPRERLFIHEEETVRNVPNRRTSSPFVFPKSNGVLYSERWQPRKENHVAWGNGQINEGASRHGRQKSLSDAIRTIRTRKGSVSANAHEIAEALKAPVSFRLIVRAIYVYKSIIMLTPTCRFSVLFGTSAPPLPTLPPSQSSMPFLNPLPSL